MYVIAWWRSGKIRLFVIFQNAKLYPRDMLDLKMKDTNYFVAILKNLHVKNFKYLSEKYSNKSQKCF